MPLRPPQIDIQKAALDILSGAPIRRIIADVTPGGGKSKLPVILASLLIPKLADKLLWVVPRNSLKYQGEGEFIDPRFPTVRRLRATDGNDVDPDRGTDGYLTTYQAIGESPEQHQAYCWQHRTILFLDEPHHIGDGLSWAAALAPMIESAVLVVYASGTLARGDGSKIAFLDYTPDGQVDLSQSDTSRVITYSRGQAIADGSILPVHGHIIDGSAEWVGIDGQNYQVDSIRCAGADRSAAVFTALRTGYAYHLIDSCYEHWASERMAFPGAQMLVVAPNIETAKNYHRHVSQRCQAEIATSENTTAAQTVIEAYKRGTFPALVTVAMAYEGLSVPNITHAACLTHIRSVPWLEQMFGRTNRVATGKTAGHIFGPADEMFTRAIRMIEAEQREGLKEQRPAGAGQEQATLGAGKKPQIEPLWSSAHSAAASGQKQLQIRPSEAEAILRKNIRDIKAAYLATKHAGAYRTAERLFHLRIMAIVNKDLDDMNENELNKIWVSFIK